MISTATGWIADVLVQLGFQKGGKKYFMSDRKWKCLQCSENLNVENNVWGQIRLFALISTI